jgi:hypothetical protein
MAGAVQYAFEIGAVVEEEPGLVLLLVNDEEQPIERAKSRPDMTTNVAL